MTTSDICILISIVAYLLLVVWIGISFSKKNKTTEDFYLGGRKLGPFVTAMSAEASDMSSWLLMGLPGVAYATGIADAFWTAVGLAIGTYINWLVVAKRLRKYTVTCNNSTTIPVFFSNRYRDDKKILSVIAAIVIIIFFVPYTASGFAACGKLFASLFGWDYLTAMVISAVVIVGYTTLGGFLAASTSDFLQSIIMTIAIFVVLGYGVITAGGIDSVIANAQSMAGYFSLTSVYDGATGTSADYGIITIFSMLAWGLGYFGMPHVLLRFMAIEDPGKLKLSRRIASVWVVISLGVAIFIGVVGNAMSKKGVIPVLEDPETIVVSIATVISKHGIAAALIAGLILAGILAATMSTADSQLLAASSSASQNIIKEVFFEKMPERAAMIIARTTVVFNYIKLKLSRRIVSVWVAISLGVAIVIGIVESAVSKKGVIPVLEDPETIVVSIATAIGKYGIAAALIVGLIWVGILVATMSTADSQRLAASSSASQNVIEGVSFEDMSERAAMIIARVTVVVISIIAIFIAKDPNSSVFEIVSFAWAGFGAAFGPVMLLALFWKRSNKWGALAGMFTGGVMVFVWKFLVKPLGGAWNIYELLPAFIVAIAVNVAVSLLTKAPTQDIVDEFERVAQECRAK